MKLVALEPESEALAARLSTDPERVSSALAFVEVLRAVRRVAQTGGAADAEGGDEPLSAGARRVLSRIALIRIDQPVLRIAADLEMPDLRALDAIHLATALTISPKIEALITYDRRLAAAAIEGGLNVEAPGADPNTSQLHRAR